MQIEQTSEQGIIVPRRKGIQQFIPFISMVIFFISMECPFIVIFIKDYDDIFTRFFSLGAMITFLLTIVALMFILRHAFRTLLSNNPVLQVNQQGIVLIDPYHFSFKNTLIPWPEIAKISCFHSQSLLLTITLKDPQHWWLSYGNGRPRKFPPNRQFGGAQFAFMQSAIAVSLLEVLQQIQENYAREIRINEIEIVPFSSPFTESQTPG